MGRWPWAVVAFATAVLGTYVGWRAPLYVVASGDATDKPYTRDSLDARLAQAPACQLPAARPGWVKIPIWKTGVSMRIPKQFADSSQDTPNPLADASWGFGDENILVQLSEKPVYLAHAGRTPGECGWKTKAFSASIDRQEFPRRLGARDSTFGTRAVLITERGEELYIQVTARSRGRRDTLESVIGSLR